jgi:adenylylsulfate kinase-like enzyme
MTGIDAPYDAPVFPELVLDTEHSELDENVDCTLVYLETHGYMPPLRARER